MSDYDINGTVFYNLVLTRVGGIPPWSALAAAWVRLIALPVGLDARAARAWNEALKQGRMLARNGAVQAVALRPGRLAARVAGASSADMRSVKISVATSPEVMWAGMAAEISKQAQSATEIASGKLPTTLLTKLLPSVGEITVEIDGSAHALSQPPDPVVVALWYAVAERMDADPWLWVLLRGQTQASLLEIIRQQARVRAQTEATQSRASVLPLKRFWVMSDVPPREAPPINEKAPPRILAQMAASKCALRVGRRSLARVLGQAMAAEMSDRV